MTLLRILVLGLTLSAALLTGCATPRTSRIDNSAHNLDSQPVETR